MRQRFENLISVLKTQNVILFILAPGHFENLKSDFRPKNVIPFISKLWHSKFLYLIFCAIIVGYQIGCAKPHERQYYVAPEIQQHFDNFKIEAWAHGLQLYTPDIIVTFGEMPYPNWAGYCKIGPKSTPIVVIRRTVYDSYTYYEREQLVFHELAHCLLKLEHNTTLDGNGQPNSIMWPTYINTAYYEAHRANYLRQLFNSAKLTP